MVTKPTSAVIDRISAPTNPVLTPRATTMNENSLICATVTLVKNEVRSP